MENLVFIFLMVCLISTQGVVDLPHYDSLQDVVALQDQIQLALDTVHLAETSDINFNPLLPIQIYGDGKRWMFNTSVKIASCGNTYRNVIFLFDTGSPKTLLTNDTLHTLYADCNQTYKGLIEEPMLINGKQIEVQEARGYFAGVNLIGGDYIEKFSVVLIGFPKKTNRIRRGKGYLIYDSNLQQNLKILMNKQLNEDEL